jgi:protein-S-isoprenylcysteine O-methyltransferase Ste14
MLAATNGGHDGLMRTVDLVITVGWLAFWGYWLVSARNIKTARTGWNRFIGVRVAVIVLVVFLVHFVGSGPHKETENLALAGAGLAVWALGLALAVWARLYIGRNWGMPMSRKDDPELVTSGPYHLIRHPIYTGIIFGMLGTALATTLFGLIAAAVLAAFFVYSALTEERYMTGLFPEQYPECKRHSKMVIPFVL